MPELRDEGVRKWECAAPDRSYQFVVIGGKMIACGLVWPKTVKPTWNRHGRTQGGGKEESHI